MKLKLILIISLINALLFFSGYALLLKPAQQQYKSLRVTEQKNRATLTRLKQISQTLSTELKQAPKVKPTNNNALIKTLSRIAKQQQLSIQQAKPLPSENKPGALLVLTGSYQSALIFIYRVNQLPFLLHWSSIVMQKLQHTLEITVHIQKDG